MLPSKQRKVVAAQERRWAAQAFRDEKYNRAQAKRARTNGNVVIARQHEQEARWDHWWGCRRMRLANHFNHK